MKTASEWRCGYLERIGGQDGLVTYNSKAISKARMLNVQVSGRRDVRWCRLWKIRRRRQRVGVTGYVDVVREGEQEPLNTRTCAIVPAAASESVTRADGRAYGKSVSRGTARGERYSGTRSHLWACKASSSSDNDYLVAWYRAGCSPTLRCCTSRRRLCLCWQTIAHRTRALPVVCIVYAANNTKCGTCVAIPALVPQH
jgi:hypothetical protein